MRFNQYSFIKKEDSIYLQELASLGFHLNPNASNKENLEKMPFPVSKHRLCPV